MKFLFGTKIRFFWVLIPFFGVLSLAVSMNRYADNLLKLYPLIIFLGGCIIFTFVYFFRAVGIGFDEVRTVGLFSSRERVMINEGKTLVLTLLPKRRILVELFGNDGVLAELDWLKTDDSGTIQDINLLRAKAIGGKGSLVKILKFYGLSAEDADALLDDGTKYEDELVTVTTSENEAQNKQVHIKFLKTI